tara:strand:+ start:139 stop:489 length:351 start_codon:yes stop_codon:yes gene_type:complete
MKKTHVLILFIVSLALAGSLSTDPAAEIPQLERTKADLTQAIQEGEQRLKDARRSVRKKLEIGQSPKTGFLSSEDPSKMTVKFDSTHAGETLNATVTAKGKSKGDHVRGKIKVRKR